MVPDKDSLILLTHIPKCAGSSFRESVIEPNIDQSMIMRVGGGIRELRRRTEDFRYLVGHWAHGVENYFSRQCLARKRTLKRVVILREPVDQMVSYYFYHKQLGEGSPFRALIEKQGLVEFYKRNWRYRNMQTQFLAGVALYSAYSPLKYCNLVTRRLVLARALQHLKYDYDHVIVQARSDAGFRECANLLGFRYAPRVCKGTVTKSRPKLSSLDESTQLELSELSKSDLILYRYAEQLAS